MNVIGSASTSASSSVKKQQHRLKVEGRRGDGYTNNNIKLNLFYDSLPNYELTLDEFEHYALKRLRVLRKIDQLNLLKQRYKPDEIRKVINDTLKKEGLYHFLPTDNNSNNNNIDEISHYILRISYCQTEDLRRWFLNIECDLLRHRLLTVTQQQQDTDTNMSSSSLSSLTIQQILSSIPSLNHLRPISKQTKTEIATPLEQFLLCTYSTSSYTATSNIGTFQPQQQQSSSTFVPPTVKNTKFYSVPFMDAIALIGRRECYLHNGYAYITESKLIDIVVQKFRNQLSYTLTQMYNQSGSLFASSSSSSSSSYETNVVSPMSSPTNTAEQERLEPFLKNINRCLTNPMSDGNTDFDVSGDGNNVITAHNLLQYKKNMPLCMRQLQVGLEQDRKLKHWGRLQYGLFLKGSGMSMEDSITFFQRHFTAVTNDQFQKEYSYNIRHMYGKEGKRASYTPYNCMKIILGNAPSTNHDHHGCPYKHYDVQHLDQLLQEIHITNIVDRNEIMKLKTSHQYQLACTKQFEIQHNKYMNTNADTTTTTASSGTNVLDNVGNHPNSWFRASIYYTRQQQQNEKME